MTLKWLVVIMGLVIGSGAAIMAFLIAYGEYSRHSVSRSRTLRLSFEAALTMFAIIAIVLEIFLPNAVAH